MICKYCGKECKNKMSLSQHELRCKNNINRKIYKPHLGCKGKNQFTKAKEEGKIYVVSEETKYKISLASKNRKHSLETKQKISKIRKKYLELNPDKIPFIINHSSNKSYPEKYFENLFIKENIPLKYHKQIGRYELDFYNDEYKKYVEIDGEQHYLPYMLKHDKERTDYLLNLGWVGIRIRWSEYLKLDNNNRKLKIDEIKYFLYGTETENKMA